MLTVEHISGGYAKSLVINDVSFHVSIGEVFGILGPNGSGKSTLLKMLHGELSPQSGEIFIQEKKLTDFNQKSLAKKIAVLPQNLDSSFSFTVGETVKTGRYSYQKGLFPSWNSDDEAAFQRALKAVNIKHLENKMIDSLSGGEKQRVFLARALAQQPEILLLDEPTNHLDISHQIQILNLLKESSLNSNLTVIAIFHDINLASLYCDRIMLLHNGSHLVVDEPLQALKSKELSNLYNVELIRREHPYIPAPSVTFNPKYASEKLNRALSELTFTFTKEYIKIESSNSMKTLSSAVIGSGFRWSRFFVNRHVDKNYNISDPIFDLEEFLAKQEIDKDQTLAMMTAARLEDYVIKTMDTDYFSIKVLVTAGISNAVDVATPMNRVCDTYEQGTVNIFIFIAGNLTEAAFIQGMMTATEAKTKAFIKNNIRDPITNTIATGTSTDSIAVCCTQTGSKMEYAGTITPLGKAIGYLVYHAVDEAIEKNIAWRRQHC